jgi:hypothetical protein
VSRLILAAEGAAFTMEAAELLDVGSLDGSMGMRQRFDSGPDGSRSFIVYYPGGRRLFDWRILRTIAVFPQCFVTWDAWPLTRYRRDYVQHVRNVGTSAFP